MLNIKSIILAIEFKIVKNEMALTLNTNEIIFFTLNLENHFEKHS